MNRYDWQSLLAASAYSKYPEASQRPVIGITGNYGDLTCKLAETYYKSVLRAGGVPVIIPPLADTDVIINTLEHVDALVLSGGGDYDPHYAGEEPHPLLGDINEERDLPELFITRLAYNRQLPVLHSDARYGARWTGSSGHHRHRCLQPFAERGALRGYPSGQCRGRFAFVSALQGG